MGSVVERGPAQRQKSRTRRPEHSAQTRTLLAAPHFAGAARGDKRDGGWAVYKRKLQLLGFYAESCNIGARGLEDAQAAARRAPASLTVRWRRKCPVRTSRSAVARSSAGDIWEPAAVRTGFSNRGLGETWFVIQSNQPPILIRITLASQTRRCGRGASGADISMEMPDRAFETRSGG